MRDDDFFQKIPMTMTRRSKMNKDDELIINYPIERLIEGVLVTYYPVGREDGQVHVKRDLLTDEELKALPERML